MTCLRLKKDKKIEDNILKDVRNLLRLKKYHSLRYKTEKRK